MDTENVWLHVYILGSNLLPDFVSHLLLWWNTIFFVYPQCNSNCYSIGCLNIGLSDSRDEDKEESQDGVVSRDVAHNLVISTAAITVMNAVFNCVILCSHSGFLNMQDKTTNPGDLEEQQVKAYLEAHPELAAQAAQGFETESSQPPPVAADFGSGTAKDSGSKSPTSKSPASKSPTSKQTSDADAENPFGSNSGASRPPAAPEKSSSQNQSQESSATTASGGGGASAAGGGKKKKKKNKKNNQKEGSGGAASSSGGGQTKEDNPFEDDNPFA
eukprot:gb/GECG01005285.1/.p1 GENE.gb/GECG01005285.1/~~gb/GECG01005285.1/.p1  ORF type:complete len:273 (+),score=52.62 gb/GECG01005285.1/:1-819(+)